mgnify:CR=1 FL=1
MAKKKQTSEKKGQKREEGKVREFRIEVSRTVDDVKTFIENFKSDVKRKKRAYQSYAKKLQKKKTSAR